jgi:glycosyltransferase involved in cell wall biosynthesis
MVLLEAMRAAVPVVASDVGGMTEVLGRDDEWVRAPADETGMAEAATRLLEDRGARRSWSERLQERFLARYSIGAVTDQVLEVYRSA